MDTFKLESSDYKIMRLKKHIEVCHKSSLSPGGIFPKKLLADIGMDWIYAMRQILKFSNSNL